MKLELEIDDHDYASLHDCLYNLTEKDFSREELDLVIEKLPTHIKGEIFSWGIADTCVRYQIYVWYRDNVMKEQQCLKAK